MAGCGRCPRKVTAKETKIAPPVSVTYVILAVTLGALNPPTTGSPPLTNYSPKTGATSREQAKGHVERLWAYLWMLLGWPPMP